MSTTEAIQLLRAMKQGPPALQQAAIIQLHRLRRTNPGVVRQAARQLGAESIAAQTVQPGQWANWLGRESSSPAKILVPATVAELQGAMQAAVDAGKRVKAVASGHSTSAVARPDDGAIAVDLGRLDSILKRRWEKAVLPPSIGTAELVRVQTGTTIRELSIALHERGLALANSGTFDGQQIYGALCTGTHGSGVKFPTLADIVVSLEMLAVVPTPSGPRVKLLRIEPTDGITDPSRFRPRRNLIQDDDVFHAAVVSFGTFGVATAMTIKTVPKYWMRETRQTKPWSWLRTRIPRVARSADHVDIHINPYQVDGDHSCVVIRRKRLPWRDEEPPDRPDDQDFVRFISKLFGSDLLGWFASNFPRLVADGIDRYTRNTDHFESASFKVLITGLGYDIEATSSEYAVGLKDGAAMIDTILGVARSHFDVPKPQQIRHSSPLGMRFVARSSQILSQHSNRWNATVELPFVLGTRNTDFALQTYAANLPEARPHWGQVNYLDAAAVARLYPAAWSKWKAVYDRFNATGTFDNRYTDQLGISR